MLLPEQDAWGQILKTYLETGQGFEAIERDDGFLSLGTGPDVYFTTFDAWDAHVQAGLGLAQGRVLDIGTGAGRHALYLQAQGHPVIAVDNSPLAIDVCRARGVGDARVLPIAEINEHLGMVDTITMLGNNFGLFANATQTKDLLERFARLTSPSGRIIAESRNPYGTENPVHLAYHARNRAQGRMSGQIRMRVRYLHYTGPWFDYLLASPDEMRELAAGTPWSITQWFGNLDDQYVAVLQKSMP